LWPCRQSHSVTPSDKGEYGTDELIRISLCSQHSFILPATSSFVLSNITTLIVLPVQLRLPVSSLVHPYSGLYHSLVHLVPALHSCCFLPIARRTSPVTFPPTTHCTLPIARRPLHVACRPSLSTHRPSPAANRPSRITFLDNHVHVFSTIGALVLLAHIDIIYMLSHKLCVAVNDWN
jgi:hypothetical protein